MSANHETTPDMVSDSILTFAADLGATLPVHVAISPPTDALAGDNFENVERIAGSDFLAIVADVARRGGRAFAAVERLGEDAGDGGLADAARADEEVGVREPALLDGVFERGGDVVLADHFVELLWSPFAGEYLILLCHR